MVVQLGQRRMALSGIALIERRASRPLNLLTVGELQQQSTRAGPSNHRIPHAVKKGTFTEIAERCLLKISNGQRLSPRL